MLFIFIKKIKLVFIILSTFSLAKSTLVNLSMLSYDPPIFNLSFSTPILLPPFQLLFNQQNIQEYFLVQSSNSWYLLQTTTPVYANSQQYSIIFNLPFAAWNLDSSNNPIHYKIIASKPNIILDTQFVFSLIGIVCMFLFCLVDVIGNVLIQIIQIYILINLKKNSNFLAKGFKDSLFLIDMSENYITLKITIPLLINVISFVIGIIVFKINLKRKNKSKQIEINQKNIEKKTNLSKLQNIQKALVQFLSFDLFVAVSNIYSFSLVYNCCELWQQYIKNQRIITVINMVLSIINFIIAILIILLKAIIINKFNLQSKQKCQLKYQFIKEGLFSQERWRKINTNQSIVWKRNAFLVQPIKILILVIISFSNAFLYSLMLFQFLHFCYQFVFRPYLKRMLMNISIVIRFLLLLYCTTVVYITLYFEQSIYLSTHWTLITFYKFEEIAFFILVCLSTIACCYELYSNSHLKRVKQQQFQLNTFNQTHAKQKIHVTQEELIQSYLNNKKRRTTFYSPRKIRNSFSEAASLQKKSPNCKKKEKKFWNKKSLLVQMIGRSNQ